MAIWNPRQVATQDVDGERGGHKNSANPEDASVSSKGRERVRRLCCCFPPSCAISCQLVSIAEEYSPLRAAWLQRAR